jgi:hypothetical protein
VKLSTPTWQAIDAAPDEAEDITATPAEDDGVFDDAEDVTGEDVCGNCAKKSSIVPPR